ncbi:hypothetical protein FRB97_003611 [Tulasnella sp. 331]|nr:hypothetical protein FRB97_003611 [Tulasnella sp. 331]
MTAQLAHLSNRPYAFEPYLWHRTSWTRVVVDEGGHLRSAQIPLNAFVSGPASGAEIAGPGNVNTHHPRAVTRKFFDKVCPKSRLRYVDVREVRRKYGIEDHLQLPTQKVMDAWVAELAEIEDTCVVVRDLPPLSAVPTILHGTLAIHLRRGDFQRHCSHLADMGSVFAGWATLPQLPDRLPEDGLGHHNLTRDEMMTRCFPRVDQLIQKIRMVKQEWEASQSGSASSSRGLCRAYMLMNAEMGYRESLTRLLKLDGWDEIVMSIDMKLTNEEKEVAVASDMMVAYIAEVFQGNGVKS